MAYNYYICAIAHVFKTKTKNMKTITIILVLVIIYGFYQLARNQKVYRIRINWIKDKDFRFYKYTYNDMFEPSLKNWLGFKFPSESDY